MENKIEIPSAIDFAYALESNNPEDIATGLKEFAKLHVKAALLAAAENADITYTEEKTWDFTYVDKETILNAYPLENIK